MIAKELPREIKNMELFDTFFDACGVKGMFLAGFTARSLNWAAPCRTCSEKLLDFNMGDLNGDFTLLVINCAESISLGNRGLGHNS